MKSMSIIAIALILFSCKKEEKVTPAPTPVIKSQDSRFIGTWAQDSSKMDGSITVGMGTTHDSLFVNSAIFTETNYNGGPTSSNSYEWKTKSDSLLLSFNGSESSHYKYSFNGATLLLYLNSSVSNDIKYWYHKR